MKYKLLNLECKNASFDDSTPFFEMTCVLQDTANNKPIDAIRFSFAPKKLKLMSEETLLPASDLVINEIFSKATDRIFDLEYSNFDMSLYPNAWKNFKTVLMSNHIYFIEEIKRKILECMEDTTDDKPQESELEYHLNDVILITGDKGNYIPVIIKGISYHGLKNEPNHRNLGYDVEINDESVHIPYDSPRIIGYVGNVKILIG